MPTLSERLQHIQAQIQQIALEADRNPKLIQLVAVSKTFGIDAILQAFHLGQRAFGENYVQEACDKIDALQAFRDQLEWHFIGPLQSNKTRAVAERFDWVHTIDRLKIAQRLSEQRPKHLPPLNVCIQVNISQEDSKHGVEADQLLTLAQAVNNLPQLRLRGLMAIPKIEHDFLKQRAVYHDLAQLFEILKKQGFAIDTLSIGMSDDLAAAIFEGATIVRLGSAIFGKRAYIN